MWTNALGASRTGAAQHSQPRQQRGSAPSPTASVASGRSGMKMGLPALEAQRGSLGNTDAQRGGLGLGGVDAQRGSLGNMDAPRGGLGLGGVDAQRGSLGGFPVLDKMALFRERWAALAPAVQCEQRCQQSELSALQGEVVELRRELGHVSSALKALEEQVSELQRQLRHKELNAEQQQQSSQQLRGHRVEELTSTSVLEAVQVSETTRHKQQHGRAEKQQQSSQQLRGHRVEELTSTSVLEAVRRLVLGLDGGMLDVSSEPQYATPEREQEAHDAEPKPPALASQTQLSEDDSVSTASWRTLKRRRSEYDPLDVSQGSQTTVYSTNRSALD